LLARLLQGSVVIASLKKPFSRRLSPVWLAIIMAVLLVLWLLLGERRSAQDEAPPLEEQSEERVASG
jgi:membrane fusion protein, multidrug efflux system